LILFKSATYSAIVVFYGSVISSCDTSVPKTPTISYVSLTSEETHPFANGNPKFAGEHDASIGNFPNVRDCLRDEEKENPNPDLRFLDWDKMSSLSDLDVCMWRIFTSYENPEKIYSWFSFHSAKSHNSVESLKETPTTNIPVKPHYFSWELSETRPPVKNQNIANYILHSFGVSVIFDQSGEKILNVSSKWAQSF